MSTIHLHPATEVEKSTTGWFNNQAKKFEASRFGWMAILLTLQSCWGSIACMTILKNDGNDVMLVLCSTISMACNVILIGQAPAKWCLASFYASMIINAALIVLNV
ncbi:MAG: hypothetical protein JST67_09255 [Bacteroidetes bacterium]|nr:hypothetical protein [Bacteroidota bacterium]